MHKVLVVDDEIEIVKFFNNFLRRKEVKVFTATNARKALEIFTQEKPALVLLDVRMPDEDGFSVLKKIKKLAPKTKVVMVTAREDKGSIVKAKKLGADNYLVKPLELEVLDSIILEYLK